ncbi:MAG TPA: dihydrolipoamide acetyltransferase family protein [Bacteroidales bacterium]
MAVPVIMPKQGQSVETCIITEWAKKKGESVVKGDILFTYETDKASFEVEAPEDGILLDVFFNDGDEVPVLTNVAVIGKAGEVTDSFRPGSAPSSTQAQSDSKIQEFKDSASTVVENSSHQESLNHKIKVSPRARVMAEKNGVNLNAIKGSGPNGRIIARDIEEANKKIMPVAAQVTPATTTTVSSSTGSVAAPVSFQASTLYSDNDFEVKKLPNIRKIIAKAMHDSISTSAQLTHHMSADVRKLQALRNKVKAEMEKGSSINITLNDMICFAVIRALEKFPDVNSHFLGDSTKTFKKVHLGLAVDTPRGLMVPTILNADDYSLKGLSGRLRDVADQCKKGSINPELLASTAASFTVSNLGNYGVEMFTPIINLPQVAILGVNTITYRPADLGNGAFGFIPVVGLSLTYDHRAVDGGPATLFLKEIKTQIENFNETI